MSDKINLTVHHRNQKGKITRTTPYRLLVVKGESIYEMPAGSGEFFLADGSPYQGAAPISKIVKPETQKAEALERENAELQAKLAKLEAEKHVSVTPEKQVDGKPDKAK